MEIDGYQRQFMGLATGISWLEPPPYTFRVSVHGTPIRFFVETQELLTALENYFPKTWSVLETPETEDEFHVRWRTPEKAMPEAVSGWGERSDPDCHFHGKFVFQRDFWLHTGGSDGWDLLCKGQLSDGFFNFLRFVIPRTLLTRRKVLFHSACVADHKGDAFLFFGFSGAGKSTMTSLCEDGRVLGDDMCVLFEKHGRVFAEPALVGQMIQDRSTFGTTFPVKAAFWLEKGRSVEIVPLADQRRSRILSSFSGLFWDQLNEGHFRDVFALLHTLESSLGLFRLRFPKQKGVWHDVQRYSEDISAQRRAPLANSW